MDNHVTTHMYGHIHSELDKMGITFKKMANAILIRDGKVAVVLTHKDTVPEIALIGDSTMVGIGSARIVPKKGAEAADAFDLISELIVKFYGGLE